MKSVARTPNLHVVYRFPGTGDAGWPGVLKGPRREAERRETLKILTGSEELNLAEGNTCRPLALVVPPVCGGTCSPLPGAGGGRGRMQGY